MLIVITQNLQILNKPNILKKLLASYCDYKFVSIHLQTEWYCVVYDYTFYHKICSDFLKTTTFEDGYEILDHLIENEGTSKEWDGFPEYIKYTEIKRVSELLDLFNVRIDGGGLHPEPLKYGQKVHPTLFTIIEKTKHIFEEENIELDNQKFPIRFII